MIEVWRDVIGYEGIYMISDQGRVKSIGYGKERILKPRKNTKDYLRVGLYKDKIIKDYYIHRLVAINFLENPENKPQVNHINGIKTDNRLENIEWCNNSENQKHAYDNGLKEQYKGSKHGRSKLTEKQVLEIRQSNLTQKELSEIFSVDQSTIGNIKNRKIWKHI